MLDLFTVLWGGARNIYVNNFCDVTLPSLMQPDNLPAAREMIGSYCIYADDSTREAVAPALNRMEPIIPVELAPLVAGPWQVNPCTKQQMAKSGAKGHYLLVVSADWAFGNGSILNMARLCDGTRNPILFGFPKIPPEAFTEIKGVFESGGRISNREMVSLWSRFGGGGPCTITPSEVPGEWIVSHRTPTPCLRPDEAIINFYSSNNTPNQGYDHALPMWMVENRYPWHFITDSDTFFVVEIAVSWTGLSGPWGLELLSRGDVFFSHCRETWRAR
ncbi:MAG: hypothetical protein WC551_08030 [Patescibacteria group bacterium]